MQMYQVCCTLQIADCNSNCHKQITLGGLQEVVSGSQTNVKALSGRVSQRQRARLIPTCSLHCTTGTVTAEHYSNTHPTAIGHIILNPMEEFYSLLRRGYINPLCDLTLLSGFTSPEKTSAEERGNFKGLLDLTLESMNLLSVDINMLKFATIIVADFSMLSYHTGEVSYLLHVILPYWCSESVLRAILVRSLRVFAFRM